MKVLTRTLGFTLIELMVSVAIVGILAAIAYPSYMNSVRKSNRADAKAELNDIAQRLQRCYTTYGKFNDATCPVYHQLTTGTSSIVTRGKYYTIKFAAAPAVSAVAYQLDAEAGLAPQTDDVGCTTLSINQLGATSPSDCW
jgi:type IV pilus assembly protein PilE